MNVFQSLRTFSERHSSLSVEVPDTAGTVTWVTVALAGSLDNESGHAFMREMETAIAGISGITGIIIECSKIKYMSSTGAGAFATIAIAASKKGMEVTLLDPPANVMMVLSLLGFDKFINVRKTA